MNRTIGVRHALGCMFVCCFLFPSLTIAGSWVQTNGPEDAAIMCFAAGGGTIYAGTQGGAGVYFTRDSGATWSPLGNGLFNRYVQSIAILNGTIYAGTAYAGVFATTDNGGTWNSIYIGSQSAYVTLVTVINGNLYVCGGDSGIVRSTNGGASWTVLNAGLNGLWVSSLVQTGTKMLAGTNSGVYISTNGGASWKLPALHSVVDSVVCYKLFVYGNHVWADFGGWLSTSTDGGSTWSPYGSQLILHQWFTSELGSSFAADATTLYVCGADSLYRTTNNGVTWSAGSAIGLVGGYYGGSAVYLSGTNLFEGTWGGGVFLSTNEGASWTQRNTGLTNARIFGMGATPKSILVAPYGGGFFRSQDRGQTWSPANTGLTDTELYQPTFAAGFRRVFVGTPYGGFGVSTDDGQTWTHSSKGLPEQPIGGVAFIKSMAFAATNLGLYVSFDSGATWTLKSKGPSGGGLYGRFAIVGDTLFADFGVGGVCKSTNYGASWTQSFLSPRSNTDTSVTSLAVNGTTVFLSTLRAGVFRTTNNGASWTGVNSGLPNLHTTQLAVSDGNVYVATAMDTLGYAVPYAFGDPSYGNGVYVTTNNGASWSPLNTGLRDSAVWYLSFCRGDLYAGTASGVWRYDFPPLCVTAASRTFAKQECATAQYDTFFVSNHGIGDLFLDTVSFAGPNGDEFALVSPQLPRVVAPRDSVAFVVRLVPAKTGTRLTRLFIHTNDLTNGPDISVLMSGASASIGMQFHDTTAIAPLHSGRSIDTAIVFRASGAVDATITNVTLLYGAAWMSFVSPTLPHTVLARPSNDSTQLRFRLRAPRDTGWFETRYDLHVLPCDIDTALTIRSYLVSGVPRMAVPYDFGTVVGSSERCESFFLRNAGNGPLTISNMKLSGADTDVFALQPLSLPITLAPTDSLFFTICFSPNDTGSRRTTLVVISDDSLSASNVVTAAVTAREEADGLSFSNHIDMGIVAVNSTKCTSIPATVVGALADTITGIVPTTNTPLFTIAGPQLPRIVAPSGRDTITVCFAPTDTGSFAVTYTVHYKPGTRTNSFTVTARSTRTTGVDDRPITALPSSTDLLFANAPNPFSQRTEIAFMLAAGGHARLSVVDMLGRTVHVIEDAELPQGNHVRVFDATELPSGIYACQLRTSATLLRRTMIVQK